MTPDSDTYTHILLNGLVWYVVLFGVPSVMWLREKRRQKRASTAQQDVRDHYGTNLRVHPRLYPNVTVLPKQRSTR